MFLGISKSSLYKMTHNQVIPYFKPNNKMVYFEKSELQKWLRQNSVAPQGQALRTRGEPRPKRSG